MVTQEILNAQAQASQQLQDIQAQRGQISAAQQQIAGFNPNISLTAQQQAGQNVESMYALRQAEATRGVEKAQQQQAVETASREFEAQAQPAEKSIREYQQQIERAIEQERDQERYSNSPEGIAENKTRVENKIKYQETLAKYKEAGLEPKFNKEGKLTEVYDVTKGYTYGIELLPEQRATDVNKLVELGILTRTETKQTVQPTATEINLATEAARVRGELGRIVGIQPAAPTVQPNLISISQRQTIGAGEFKVTPPEPVRLGTVVSAPFEIVKLGVQATTEAAIGTAGKLQRAVFGDMLPGKGLISEGGLVYIKPTSTAIPTVQLPSALSGVKEAQQQFIGRFGTGEGYKTVTPEQIGEAGKLATELYVSGVAFKGIQYLPKVLKAVTAAGFIGGGTAIATPAIQELSLIKSEANALGYVTPEMQQRRYALGMQFVAGTALALGGVSMLSKALRPEQARFLTQEELNKLPKKTEAEIYGVSASKEARTTIDITRGEYPGAYLEKVRTAQGNRGYIIKIPSSTGEPFTLQLTERARLKSIQGVESNIFGEVVKTDTGISGVRVYTGELLNPQKKIIENLIGESIEKGSGDKTYLLTKISRTPTQIEGNIFQRTFQKPATQTSTYIEQITSKKAYAYAADIYKGAVPAYTPFTKTQIEIATPSMQFDKTVNFPKRATIIESTDIAKTITTSKIKGFDVANLLPTLDNKKLAIAEQSISEKQLVGLFGRTQQVIARGESTLIYAPDLKKISLSQTNTPLKTSIDISVKELSGTATGDKAFRGRSFEFADIRTQSISPVVSGVSPAPKKTIASIYAVEAKEKDKAVTHFIIKYLPKEIDKTITATAKSMPSTSIFYGKGAAGEIEQTIGKLSLNKEFGFAALNREQLTITPTLTPYLITRTGALTPLTTASYNVGAVAVIPIVIGQSNILKTAQEQTQLIKQIQQPRDIITTKFETKQIQIHRINQTQSQELIQQQQQRLNQVNIQQFKPTQYTQQIGTDVSTTLVPVEVPPFIFKLPTAETVKTLLATRKKNKAYQAQIKRKGVFINVGKPTTLSTALQVGSRAALTSIAATFRAVPTKVFTEAEESGFRVSGAIFRAPKNRAPLTFVQRKGGSEGGVGRLSTPQEIQDIMASKRSSTRPIKKPKRIKPILSYGGNFF